MTFSIVGLDPETGEIGVAVATKNLAVGAAVVWARTAAGAIATQAQSNVEFGPSGLDLLEQGLSAQETLDRLIAGDDGRDHRQVGVIDSEGHTANWTGDECQPWAGHSAGEGYACQGNILAGPQVIDALTSAFEVAEGPLPERMMAGLEAAQAAGGDSRGRQSSAIYIAKAGGGILGRGDRYIDLRVDDHTDPIPELRRLLTLHRGNLFWA